MERGVCNGSSTTNKKSSSSNSAAPAAARHSNQPFRLMVGVHRGTNLSRPFEGGGAGGANEALLTHDVVSSCYGGGENFPTSTTTPFDIYSYKSPGEMAAAVGVSFPFTSAQWRELERQAMIYKYMMYSVPVPSDLLFPLTRNFPDPPASSLHNMTTHSRNGDPEPGRCKRTDGKKWRCTKDVAPYQKYCERHLHRGRPRSRKPVEPKSSNGEKHNKKTRPVVSSRQAVAANDQHQQQQEPLLLFSGKPGAAVNNGDLGLVVEAEMAGLNVAQQHQQQQWQILMDANMGFTNEGSSSLCDSSHLFEKDYMLGYPNLTTSEINAPAGFIDAWSINNSTSIVSDEPPLSTSNHKNVSPSLDLSMAMTVGSILDDEMGSCDRNSSKDLKWLNPVSWDPFSPGGPLAEALHPGSLCTNPASPHDSINTPATTVSSPSGVLQRTFFSHSDSSVCNSPRTFQEVPFYRPN